MIDVTEEPISCPDALEIASWGISDLATILFHYILFKVVDKIVYFLSFLFNVFWFSMIFISNVFMV